MAGETKDNSKRRMLSIKQFLAENPGIFSERTLRRRIDGGEIEAYQPRPGAKILIPEDALDGLTRKAASAHKSEPAVQKTSSPRWEAELLG